MNSVSVERKILGWGGYEFVLIVCFFFAWGLAFLDALSISFLAPLIVKEFAMNNTQVGFLSTASVGSFAVASLLFGVISDRMGLRKKLLVPSLLLCAAFSALGALTQTYTQLLITRVLVGFFEGPILPLMMALMAKESTPSRFGFNTGIINSGVGIIAIMLGPTFVTQVASATNWRMAFLIASIPTFIMGLIIAKVVREVRVDANLDASGNKASILSNFAAIFKHRNMVVCFFIGLFGMSGYWSLMQFAAMFWSNTGGLSITTVGYVISSMGIGTVFYCMFVPKLSDYIGRKPTIIISYFLCALVPLTMALLGGAKLTISAYILFAGIPGAMTPLYMTIIPLETIPSKLAGSAGGFILAAAQLVGGAIWPVFLGVLADATGNYSIGFSIAAVLFAIATALGFLLRETNTKEKRQAYKASILAAKEAAKAAQSV